MSKIVANVVGKASGKTFFRLKHCISLSSLISRRVLKERHINMIAFSGYALARLIVRAFHSLVFNTEQLEMVWLPHRGSGRQLTNLQRVVSWKRESSCERWSWRSRILLCSRRKYSTTKCFFICFIWP